MVTGNQVTMVYLEPTPYIEAFIRACREIWEAKGEQKICALYVGENLSQSWGVAKLGVQTEAGGIFLPDGRIAALRQIHQRLRNRSGTPLLHLAGWGHPVLAGAITLANALGVRVTVESDTSEAQSTTGIRYILKSVLYSALMQMPTHFLPGGTRQLQYLENLGVSRQRMTIAQMTVDVRAIQHFRRCHGDAARSNFRNRLGIPETASVVLFLGRLEAQKGLADALTAFELLKDRSDTRLLIVGDGSLRDFVAEKAAADPRIVAPGRLSGLDVWAAYLAADVMIVPSSFEPWGLVVNEAMAAGLPVIASDRVGAVSDLVLDGDTGIVVRAGDPPEIAAAVARLFDNKALYAKLRSNADTLITGWSIEEEARIVTDVWRVLLERGKKYAL